MVSQQGTFRKVWISIFIILGIAVVLWLCWISMPVLVPFLVGILLAYLLWPLVAWLEKRLPPRAREKNSKRVAAVIIVFLVFSILLVVFITYVGAAVISASAALGERAPDMITGVTSKAGEWLRIILGTLPPDLMVKIQQALAGAGPAAGKFVQDFLAGSVAVIPSKIPTITGFITLPFFLIFVLLKYERYGQYFNDIFPAKVAGHATQILKIFGDQMGRYIRFQIIMAAVAGLLIFAGTAVLGVPYAAALGAVAAFVQVIPILGPFVSAAFVLVVTLALKPDAILWVLGLIILTQVIVAIVQGPMQEKHFPLDPAVIMVLMTVGGFIGFYWGVILALPVAATVWDIYKYFRDLSRAKQLETGAT
jgi:predicted PurR-regulated permease PerM